jgi:hypothetical protein
MPPVDENTSTMPSGWCFTGSEKLVTSTKPSPWVEKTRVARDATELKQKAWSEFAGLRSVNVHGASIRAA